MISEYENTLRALIIHFIGATDSADYKISDDRIAKWKERREVEFKKSKGVSCEARILYYSDFYDLKTIVAKSWEKFHPVLHDKKRFEVFFDELENYRNTTAHGRNLTLSQESLLKGILLDLKNKITVYHNKNEMKEDFFIRISRVNDNLGNVWEFPSLTPKAVLRVGDEYELFIEANDPKGRNISYKILTSEGFLMEQTSNRFNFTITNDLVGPSVRIYINAFTPESEYKNEAGMAIALTILPK